MQFKFLPRKRRPLAALPENREQSIPNHAHDSGPGSTRASKTPEWTEGQQYVQTISTTFKKTIHSGPESDFTVTGSELPNSEVEGTDHGSVITTILVETRLPRKTRPGQYPSNISLSATAEIRHPEAPSNLVFSVQIPQKDLQREEKNHTLTPSLTHEEAEKLPAKCSNAADVGESEMTQKGLEQLRGELDTAPLKLRTTTQEPSCNDGEKRKQSDAAKSEELGRGKVKIAELQQRNEMLAVRLGSVQEQLENKDHMVAELQLRNETLAVQLGSVKEQSKDKDRTIASLTAEVEQWKRADAQRAEQLAIALEQVQKLQKDLSTSASKLADLQTRYESQSHELISTREQLEKSGSRTEEIHKYYDKQLMDLKLAVAERQPQLFEVQRFVALADEYATGMIIKILQNINADIQDSTSLVAGYFIRDYQPVMEPTEEQTFAMQRVFKSIGQTLVDYLGRGKSRDDVVLFFTIALRAYLVYRIHWIMSSWTLDKGWDVVNEVLDKIYEPLQKMETPTVTGRWRSLTRTYITSFTVLDSTSLTSTTMEGLSDIVVAAGCATSASAANSKISTRFRHNISFIISTAVQLRKIVGNVISSDFEIIPVRHSRLIFDATTMNMDAADDGKGQAKKVRKATGRRVLCATSLGLTKRELLPGGSSEDTSTLVKARVFLE